MAEQGRGLKWLDDGPVVCAEGYLFELERRGYLQAGAFVPEVVLEHPEKVSELHREFVHAGSDIVEAFTYYAHREKLRGHRPGAPARADQPAGARARPPGRARERRAVRRQRLQHERVDRRGVARHRPGDGSRSRSAGRSTRAPTSSSARRSRGRARPSSRPRSSRTRGCPRSSPSPRTAIRRPGTASRRPTRAGPSRRPGPMSWG
jgi:hypothetical protein